jgi:hypothetical protein
MLKAIDVPRELKKFNSLFHGFEGLELSRVFDDFLTLFAPEIAKKDTKMTRNVKKTSKKGLFKKCLKIYQFFKFFKKRKKVFQN